jgi:hypothetical protein
MGPDNLAVMIRDNAEELSKRLCKDLFSREETKSYHKLSQDEIYGRGHEIYSKLDVWLSGGKAKSGEMKSFFVGMGRDRCREGITLRDEVMMLMLVKRHLWLFVLEKNFFDSSYELQNALQFNNRVVMFFDRVIFYVSQGYEN